MREGTGDYSLGSVGSNLPADLLKEYAKRNMDILAYAKGAFTPFLVRKRWNGERWEEVS